jgi:hypothetical protein
MTNNVKPFLVRDLAGFVSTKALKGVGDIDCVTLFVAEGGTIDVSDSGLDGPALISITSSTNGSVCRV